jgi:hypothetical protein
MPGRLPDCYCSSRFVADVAMSTSLAAAAPAAPPSRPEVELWTRFHFASSACVHPERRDFFGFGAFGSAGTGRRCGNLS